MKRLAQIILSVCLCGILGGCGVNGGVSSVPDAETVSQAVQQPFDAVAEIKMGGIEATADLNKSEEDVFTFTFTAPKTLSGMTVTMDKENIGLSYLGLHVEADSEEVLSSSVTKAIVASINKAAEPEGITVGVEGTAITVSGETESGEFVLTLDPRSRSMLSLSIPELDLTCHFGG
ncbi:MAG: hypothetical protein ACOX6P_10735 [Candidatus Merdivicinus sp.]|jgi:hypothetical protein